MKNKIVFNEIYQKTNYFVQNGKNDKISIKNKKFYDLSFCSGVLLLGHNSKIFRETLKDFSKKKISIFAHPNIYTEKLAEKIKIFFPNFEKIIFCNSGTESVIKALRICRSINNKRYIVSVTGSWHGSVDQTLYFPDKKVSFQLGSGGFLSKYLKIRVISDFRQNDILNGGQGAPIGAFYNQYLANKLRYKK